MGLSCFRAISGIGLDGLGWMDGWDLCAGLFYEHRFAMLIRKILITKEEHSNTHPTKPMIPEPPEAQHLQHGINVLIYITLIYFSNTASTGKS